VSIQDLSDAVRKHWAVVIAVCIVLVPSMWFVMDYLYKTRLEERDAKIRAIEETARRRVMDRQREDPAQTQAPGPTQGTAAVPAEATSRTSVHLTGKIGVSVRWGSAWLDLDSATDFARGDRLRLRIGGSADRILIRLLPQGVPPDDPVGILGGSVTVPKGRVVEVTLATDQRRIIQISVHGGPNPWGTFPLGDKNGPAILEAVELVR